MQWLRLYDSVVDDPKVQRLDGNTFKVWINLLCLANRSEPRGLLPTTADLVFSLRVTKPKLQRILADLVAHNLIDVVDGETLAIHNWNMRQRQSDDVAKRVRKHRDEPDSNVSSNVTETSPEQNRAEQKQTQTRTDLSKAEKPHPDPDGFVGFWSAYPKKEGRKQTVDQWRKLAPDESLVAQIVAAVEAQKQGRKWQEGFVKAPHRWLRDRNWLDEVEPPRIVQLPQPGPPTRTKADQAAADKLQAIMNIGR